MARKSRNKRTQVPYASEIKARLDQAAAEHAENEVKGERFFYQLRNFWGVLLAVALVLSIVFQFLLTLAVGAGWLKFEGYTTFLNIVAGENFVQVIGLCTIVVSFLFPKNGPPKE